MDLRAICYDDVLALSTRSLAELLSLGDCDGTRLCPTTIHKVPPESVLVIPFFHSFHCIIVQMPCHMKALLEACRLFLRQCNFFFWMAAEHVHRRYLKQDNFDRHGTLYLWSETPTKYNRQKRKRENNAGFSG